MNRKLLAKELIKVANLLIAGALPWVAKQFKVGQIVTLKSGHGYDDYSKGVQSFQRARTPLKGTITHIEGKDLGVKLENGKSAVFGAQNVEEYVRNASIVGAEKIVTKGKIASCDSLLVGETMDSETIATELIRMAKEMVFGPHRSTSDEATMVSLGKRARPFSYVKVGDKFTFKDGDEPLTKTGPRSYTDSKGRKFQTGTGSTTFPKMGHKTASRDSVLEAILPVDAVADMQGTIDDQTWELAVEVYRKLEDVLSLTQGQKEALNRLRMSATTHKSWPADQHRNNIFKAAHALGIQLPSASF